MKISKSMYYWFTLFASCFIAYQQIMDYIRPNDTHKNLTISYLLGLAPNFFPAIGIPALFVLLIPQMNFINHFLYENKHILANLISLFGLISWEFIQKTSTKLHFDWNDILWTFLGAIIFHIIWIITPSKFKEITPTGNE